MARATDWQTVKGIKGLQVRAYSTHEKAYRLKQSVKNKIVIDHFGVMTESEALKIIGVLKLNRESGVGPQTYKEMQEESYELERAEYIAKTAENKRIIAQDNFTKQNSLAYFFDEIYWPYRSTYGNPKSNKNIPSTFNNWWRDNLGHIPITELKYTDIDKVLQRAKNLGRTDKTVKDIYNTLQAIYNYAKIYFSAHYSIALPEFCGKILRIKRPDNEKVCWLTYDEANLLLDTLYKWPTRNGYRDVYAMSVLALYSGLRFGDIAKLRWRDVEGDIAYAHGTKSGQSYGVHLDIKPIQDMLTERKSFFPERKPEDYIFLNANGEKFNEIPKQFKKVVAHLGLNETPRRKGDPYEKINFHSLRHTFASWLAIEGVDIYAIRALMGHNDIKMTQRYAKLSKEHTQKHVAQIAHHYQRNQGALTI